VRSAALAVEQKNTFEASKVFSSSKFISC